MTTTTRRRISSSSLLLFGWTGQGRSLRTVAAAFWVLFFMVTTTTTTCQAFVSPTFHSNARAFTISSSSSSVLQMSLKPAAIPLMDAGKALARSGELWIDLTKDLELYGGALSSSGALIRNAGDALAQAAALCRFKTGTELACDEIREAATCLTECVDKLQQAKQEAVIDEDAPLEATIDSMVSTMQLAGSSLESAGAGILMRQPLGTIGGHLVDCGNQFQLIATCIQNLSSSNNDNGQVSSQRMAYAAEQMILAGQELQPKNNPDEAKNTSKGKGWLKG